MRVIDVEYVIFWLKIWSENYDVITLHDMIELLEKIEEMRDAQLVVRCENCINYCTGIESDLKGHCMLSGMVVDDDDYCSYGAEGV